MSGCKDRILFKGKQFVEDFKSLNSSYAEVVSALKRCGLSAQLFTNWRARADANGNYTAAETTLRKLCAVSGLTYDDYFIKSLAKNKTTRKKTTKTPSTSKKSIHTCKMKNGVVVTTYTSAPGSKNDDNKTHTVELHSKLSSFKNHLIVYRKLLGISTSEMKELLNIENYSDIENGKATMSVSTYIAISGAILDQLKITASPQIKSAFILVATEYNDIYIRSTYFGDE